MTVTKSQLEKVENVFSAESTNYDTRHKLNLSRKAVPSDLLRLIEAGCPLETLEQATADYPVCKYKTQITIHGRFPETETRRIGEYVNLVRNKNQSIGIRWSAIDCEKKERLFRRIRSLDRSFGIVHNSTAHYIQKVKVITRETAQAVIADFKAVESRIDKSLFYGGTSIYTGSCFGVCYAVLAISVNAFYERNFDAIVRTLTGMDDNQIAIRTAEIEAEEKKEREEYERRNRQWIEERKAEKEAWKKKLDAWKASNPPPSAFERKEGYTLKEGDIYAKIHCEGYGATKHPQNWTFYKVTKSFGRLIAKPCTESGGKPGPFESSKGKAIDKPTASWLVKVA